MSSERCRKGEHNCFESAASRRERALSANLAQGLYPDFMKLNPKLNEFVAASILEKLRLKGLAAPLHLYKGRYLPSDVLADMVLKPKKKKVTDRYYFGYVPPPNRPRISAEFRRYLQQFSERHRAEESDMCYSYAMKKVRRLAAESAGQHLSLPQTLAEVVRAQEEPGFGVKRLRRPHTAVI
ncbi:hypothetical protein FJT64_021725 [Amphibalanus amphitrite]|uniref:Uncharacterized protein n=1 Tax=Amphibalanus amphitrite TaxID=1232801 RepID=A0A6A4WL39_AMPAM|nr:hypothetical protein FJT64_021725 [Amphibalanus amphitrite]